MTDRKLIREQPIQRRIDGAIGVRKIYDDRTHVDEFDTAAPKGKEKRKMKEASSTATAAAPAPAPKNYVRIPMSLIRVSPFEIQALRRARFTKDEIEELAQSIKEHGLIQPITVRPVSDDKKGDYEIVAGELRFTSNQAAGYDEIDSIVREMDDNTAHEIQIIENARRKNPHPLDEAVGYKYLIDNGATAEEVAAKIGCTVRHVHERIKLNALIPKLRKLLEKGTLPLLHAVEIAKYPPVQQEEILDNYLYDDDYWDEDDQKVVSLKDLIGEIESQMQKRLKRAPFSMEAKDLRKDGLSCVECQSRTGANPTLFEKAKPDDDRCLDHVCYLEKTKTFVQITRDGLTRTAIAGGKPKGYEAPIVNPENYSQDLIWKDALNAYRAHYIKGKKDECDSKESAVNVARGVPTMGKAVLICRDEKCQIHFAKKVSTGGSSAKPGSTKSSSLKPDSSAEQEQGRKRKEELWNLKVADTVRYRIFRDAAKIYATDGDFGADFDDILPDLVAKLWGTSSQSDYGKTKQLVVMKQLIELDPKNKSIEGGAWSTIVSKTVSGWPIETQRTALFLFAHGDKGGMYWASYKSQKEVKELAEGYGLDYRLLDAQVRLELSAKKHMPAHKEYLAAVEKGTKTATIPRLYSDKWKSND